MITSSCFVRLRQWKSDDLILSILDLDTLKSSPYLIIAFYRLTWSIENMSSKVFSYSFKVTNFLISHSFLVKVKCIRIWVKVMHHTENLSHWP